MPRRSNLFQEVVAIIHAHMAEGAVVEESALLVNRLTGEQREVDVVIRSETAGHPFVIGVEASALGRKASADWVEQMVGKHKNLPTDKLVLVAEGGFTRQATELAAAEGVITLSPEDVSESDPTYSVVNSLRSAWPKTVALTPERVQVHVQRPGEDKVIWFRGEPDLGFVLEDGSEIGPLIDVLQGVMEANMPAIVDQLGLTDVSEDTDAWFTLQVGPPWTVPVEGVGRTVHVRWEGAEKPELHLVDHLLVVGKAHIDVTEFPLTHRRLGEVMYAYGEGKVGGRDTLLLITEGAAGGKATIRVRPLDADKAAKGTSDPE